MTAYWFFTKGNYWAYPGIDGRTHFIIQSDKRENFNDATLIANASYLQEIPMWRHDELHLTRAWVVYAANAADTRLTLYACTGIYPITPIVVPIGRLAATTTGIDNILDSGEIDIGLEPQGRIGVNQTTSGVQFILMHIANVNAADDAVLVIQGWYRDTVETDITGEQRVVVDNINVWPWKRG